MNFSLNTFLVSISGLPLLYLQKSELYLQYVNLAIARGYPAGNYMFKVNHRNTRTRCEICLKLTINFEQMNLNN